MGPGRQLVTITKIAVSDQRGNEHINGAPERYKARLVSEQDQQVTAKFNNDGERSEYLGAGRPCRPM
jgi:hypothetical protein